MSFPFNLSSLKNWAILLLLLVSISCAFSVFLVWARFTAPNPEIMRPQLLADYRVADKDNAFFILRGMTSAASLDAYTIGLNA